MTRYFGVLIAFLVFSPVALADRFPDVNVRKINDRVYALLGPIDVPNKQNGGYVNNNLVIIGDKGVILVDAGSHKAVAEHIRKAIGTVTPQTTIPAKSRQSMEIDGVKLELITTDTAHTEGDMMVWLPEDGILASGDILVHDVNPNFADGNLKKWIGVVDELLKLPLKTVMPGHGALMQRKDVTDFRILIAGFYKTVEDIYKSGGAEADVRKKLDLAKWQQLARYEDLMGRNISKVWLEVEANNF